MLRLILFTEDEELFNKCSKHAEYDSVIHWDNSFEAGSVTEFNKEDTVVVVAEDRNREAFFRQLLLEKGVSLDNIIDFYGIYNLHIPYMVADRAMANPFHHRYRGLIFGLSHAEVGIIADNMTYDTANLAVSSQDLCYNYKTLEYLADKYPQKIEGLDYLVLDMYKYNYFNFDTSLSKMIYLYYQAGGFNKYEHNYAKNKNYNFSYRDMVDYILKEKRCEGITAKAIDKWKELFVFSEESIDRKTYLNVKDLENRCKIITDREVDSYNYSPSNVLKRFEETICENIGYFENIISFAKSINPGIRIYVIQMPMQKDAWERAKEFYLPWKEDFESIIRNVQARYDFEYIDMTEHPISQTRCYWQDTEHFNYYGALQFTKVIDDIVCGRV